MAFLPPKTRSFFPRWSDWKHVLLSRFMAFSTSSPFFSHGDILRAMRKLEDELYIFRDTRYLNECQINAWMHRSVLHFQPDRGRLHFIDAFFWSLDLPVASVLKIGFPFWDRVTFFPAFVIRKPAEGPLFSKWDGDFCEFEEICSGKFDFNPLLWLRYLH